MFFENLGLALESLKANKMRALLTMLGIIIGVSSVIGIMSIGDVMSNYITKQVASFGITNIYVQLVNKDSSDSEVSMSAAIVPAESDLITEEQIGNVAKIYDKEISNVSYTETVGNGQVKDAERYANVGITGVSAGYPEVNNLKLVEGRFIAQNDIAGYKNVAVVTDKLAKKIFGGQSPLMKEIKVYRNDGDGVYTYTIIGVYKYEAASIFDGGSSGVADKDISTKLLIPVNTAKQYSGTTGYYGFTAMADVNADTKVLSDKIEKYLNKYYEKQDDGWSVYAFNVQGEMETMTKIVNTVSLAIGVIAGISLIVGGVGVMNIMLVSVTERTREIGVRKALGAKSKQIQSQFVTEAVLISMAGGVIGAAFGIGLAAVVMTIAGDPFKVQVPVVAACMLFSLAIGVFFGYYPAHKAAKLDPIEALRYE
ncbi:ABC transporter permease [Clostridia bacterium]|nr:ABC transporter permease [Clostridia bacterium]